MRLDRRGIVLALAITTWAGFFDWLWLSGRAGSYVGSRTGWVVPFGAIVLTLTAVVQLARAVRRRGAGRPLRLREAGGLVALVAPVLAVLVIPAPTLGAFAVNRKSADRALVLFNHSTPPASKPLRLLDLAVASASPDYARRRGVALGRTVSVSGFVSANPGAGVLEVSRFYTYCCAADAIPYSVAVSAPAGIAQVAKDTWVRVTGQVTKAPDGSYAVSAMRVERVAAPRDPYAAN